LEALARTSNFPQNRFSARWDRNRGTGFSRTVSRALPRRCLKVDDEFADFPQAVIAVLAIRKMLRRLAVTPVRQVAQGMQVQSVFGQVSDSLGVWHR
jgi:hypothetical protein